MAAFDDWSSSGGMAGDLGGSGWAPTPPPQLAAAEGEAATAEAEELGDESSDEEEERPRFELEQVAWEKEVPGGATVKRLAVGNGVGLLVTDSPGRVEQVWVWELVKGGGKVPVEVPALEEQDVEVAFASVCPIGCHAFISLSNGEVYYLNLKTADSSATSLKAKGPIKRLKGVVLASLAWDTQNISTGKTGDVLLGTTVGTIWHVALESSNFMDKKFVNQVYQLGLSISICGLELVRVPGHTKSWFAMAATAKPTRLYEFSGGPTIEAMFERYAGPENLSFRELPGTLASCELRTFLSQGSSSSSFMLISEVGLYVGLLQPDSRDNSRLVSEQHRIVVLPSKTMTSGEVLEACPRSAAETSHHYVLAYCSWLVVVSKLNEEVVHEERFNQHLSGNLIGLTLDQHNGSMWVLSENEIAHFKAENEEGQLWRVYLDQAIANNDPEKFSEALAFCQTDLQKDKVLTMRADFHFKKGEYKEAATLYAQTKRSFEEISLMLIDNTKREALRVYLTLKLANTSGRLKTQRTIIAVWLVELWLKQISDNEAGMYNLTTLDETSKGDKEKDTTLQDEFHAFLAKNWSLLSPAKDTVYQLIDGHGRDEDYIIFALCNSDFDRVVVRYIHRNLHDKAISVLAQQALRWTAAGAEPPLGFIELYYKYSPELMEHCPTLTVDAWIDAAQVLDPCKLIPALVRYSQIRESKTAASIPLEEDDQAVRYLEHCVHVQGNADQAVHNLLLSLYAKRSDDGNLRDFVRSPNPSYDLKYALRVCTQAHQSRACVDIYSAMGLYAEAVRLALDLDPELARANAEFAKDESMRKKLWLLIAEHEIKAASKQAKGLDKDSSQDDVVKRALEILQETDALTVEDILEFLPDFVAIGDLKEEICQSLHRFSVDIDTLKEEIGDLTENAESLRAEISAQEDQFTIVRGGHGCDLCGKKLDKKALYVFPCTHTFHTSCLLDEVARHVGEEQLQRINEMRMLLNEEEHESYGENVASSNLALRREEGQSEDLKRSSLAAVDDFLAAACPFCGELMIQSIAEPFVTTRGIHGEEDDDWAI